ncbi:MAG: ABC transporter permease [Conexibacter sp.]
MTELALDAPAPARAFARPGLGRLMLVELRKMADTRAGFWLLLSTALLVVGVGVVACFAFGEHDRTLLDFLAIASAPATVLMPVVGILLVSSEWSQRTAIITFTLTPERWRVLSAKLLAGLALCPLALGLCLAVSLLATAVAGSGEHAWSLSAALLGQAAVAVAVPMVAGIGFGAVLLAPAPAIVLSFALPMVWSALGSLAAFDGPARWLDQNRALDPLLDHALSGTQWAHVATSVLLWTALPVALGYWRVARSDMR